MTPPEPPFSPDEPRFERIVVGLCAAWCNTCGDFRTTFDRLARERPATRFVWLDIEDDADAVGDVEVDNFPTIAVYAGGRLLHFGVTLPHGGVVGRLIDALDTDSPAFAASDAVVTLPDRLDEAHRQPGV